MNRIDVMAQAHLDYSKQLRETTQALDALIAALDAAHWRRWQAYWERYVGGEGN